MVKHTRRAFTLVELLVVIGIIAILVSLLLPSLNRARQQAISAVCMSQLQQIGKAALMYANDNKGWFPPSQGDDNTTPTDEKFLDYGAAATNPLPAKRYIVYETMARYAGYVVPPYDPLNPTTFPSSAYVPPNTPIFYCPADNQLVGTAPPWPTNQMMEHPASGNNGSNDGKMRYWWLANPWHQPGSDGAGAGSMDAVAIGDEDREASGWYWHLENTPTSGSVVTWPNVGPPPWFDSRTSPQFECIPGIDYLRKISDKHQSDVAVCCCRSKQVSGAANLANPLGATYYMHGRGSYNGTTGWKNELFGDGHCEIRHSSQLVPRWSQPSTAAGSGPQFW